MKIVSGKVVGGRVVVDAYLPEGVDVTVLVMDGEETLEVDAELEAVLLESIAQGQRGETISAEASLDEMRDCEVTARLNEVYATESSTLDPVLQSIQARSISNDKWK